MSSQLTESEYWHLRAVRARIKAASMTCLENRAAMIDVAAVYSVIGDRNTSNEKSSKRK